MHTIEMGIVHVIEFILDLVILTVNDSNYASPSMKNSKLIEEK